MTRDLGLADKVNGSRMNLGKKKTEGMCGSGLAGVSF